MCVYSCIYSDWLLVTIYVAKYFDVYQLTSIYFYFVDHLVGHVYAPTRLVVSRLIMAMNLDG